MKKTLAFLLALLLLAQPQGFCAFRRARFGYPGTTPQINWDAPLNKGLVYWSYVTQLGGATLFDLARKNNGTLVSGPSWYSSNSHPGGWGHLVYVAASSTHTDLPTTFQMPTTALTVSAWFYINNSLGVGFDSLAFRIDKAPNYHLFDFYLCYSGDGNGYFGWYNNAETRIIISPASLGLVANTWQFITYTWTAGGSHAIYNNGVSKYSAAVADGSFDTSGATSIAIAPLFTGNIDDFRIYNVALTPDQVMKLYRASSNGYPQELNRQRIFWPQPAGGGGGVTTSAYTFLGEMTGSSTSGGKGSITWNA